MVKISKIFYFIAKSSSVQMYIKQAVCFSKTNWWKVNDWKPVQRCQEKGKTKEAKEESDSFVLTEWLWTNCHTIKIKIKKTTPCTTWVLPMLLSSTLNKPWLHWSKLSKTVRKNWNSVKNYWIIDKNYDVGGIILKKLQLFRGF